MAADAEHGGGDRRAGGDRLPHHLRVAVDTEDVGAGGRLPRGGDGGRGEVLPAGAAQGGHQRRHWHDRRHDEAGEEAFVHGDDRRLADLYMQPVCLHKKINRSYTS